MDAWALERRGGVMPSLDAELDFFIENQDDLVRKHGGKVLVLRGQVVVGVFDTALEAYLDAQTRYEPGTYAIQRCSPGPEAYTVDVAPSVSFAGAE